MNWLSLRGMNGQGEANVVRLRRDKTFARVELIASQGDLRRPATVVDFNFAVVGIANGARARIPRQIARSGLRSKREGEGWVRGCCR